eukprot:m51a1_g4884 hypothetical protein (451) ;mRNA; r:44459-46034
MAEDKWPLLVSELHALGLEPSAVTEEDVRGVLRELGATARQTLAAVGRWRRARACPEQAADQKPQQAQQPEQGPSSAPAPKKRVGDDAQEGESAARPAAKKKRVQQQPQASEEVAAPAAEVVAAAAAEPEAEAEAPAAKKKKKRALEKAPEETAPEAAEAKEEPAAEDAPAKKKQKAAPKDGEAKAEPAAKGKKEAAAKKGDKAEKQKAAKKPTAAAALPAKKVKPAASVYVCNLPWKWALEDLRKAFEESGCKGIVDARVMLEKFTKRSKGFGFVDFATLEDAQAAAQAMNGKLYGERQLSVEVSARKGGQPAAAPASTGSSEAGSEGSAGAHKNADPASAFSVWVGNYPYETTEQQLREAFEANGCGADVAAVRMLLDKAGQALGYGFVDFKTYDAAVAASQKMNGVVVGERDLNVKLSDTTKRFGTSRTSRAGFWQRKKHLDKTEKN